MLNFEQMALVLSSLPDPAFVFSRAGKYVALFGGRDTRYYHDGSALVGCYIADLIKSEKANWFLAQIHQVLTNRQLLIVEYELSNRDVKGLSEDGPAEPIWFEGRIQALDFQVDNEEVVLWVASNITARHSLEIKLKELSFTDSMSGLYNRRKMDNELKAHFELFARYQAPSSLLVFDLDNLKLVNDTAGHSAGDALIQAVASVCTSQLRVNDIASRFGGDEFAVLLPNTDFARALQFAQRLHELLRVKLQGFSVAGVSASVSMGVATMATGDANCHDVLARADMAMYQAKHKGKNQVVAA